MTDESITDPDRYYFEQRTTTRTYVSKRFISPLLGLAARYAHKVFEGEGRMRQEKVGDHLVIRETPHQKQQVRATIIENSHEIQSLCFQKFNLKSGPSDRFHFSFNGKEVVALFEFLLNIKRIYFPNEEKFNVSDDEFRKLIVSQAQASRVFADNPQLVSVLAENPDLMSALAQDEALPHDIVAVGYRRKQLKRFESLLSDPSYFDAERKRLKLGPEALWQAFFEQNQWIFGYGLSYIFMSGLDQDSLEQVTTGVAIAQRGKRIDALMKTQAAISSLCFVEIKRHDEALVSTSQYRPDVWAPSRELSSGVAQVQATVRSAIESLQREVRMVDEEGNPTGETLFNVSPRSFLLIGNLGEFLTEQGINRSKYSSFELYRRHLLQPEVITYDELLYRARFIADHHGQATQSAR